MARQDKRTSPAATEKDEEKGKEEAMDQEAAKPGTAGASGSPSPRRAPGQKEVIPFAWKVCGYSFDGQILTLFKSVERAESEAQLSRLQKEQYYEGLNVYPIDEKVPAPVMAKKTTSAAQRAAASKSKKTSKKASASRSKSSAATSGVEKSARKTASKKTASKSAAKKTSKKSTTAKKKTPKKAAKAKKTTKKKTKSRK